jgi:hypothetical protein
VNVAALRISMFIPDDDDGFSDVSDSVDDDRGFNDHSSDFIRFFMDSTLISLEVDFHWHRFSLWQQLLQQKPGILGQLRTIKIHQDMYSGRPDDPMVVVLPSCIALEQYWNTSYPSVQAWHLNKTLAPSCVPRLKSFCGRYHHLKFLRHVHSIRDLQILPPDNSIADLDLTDAEHEAQLGVQNLTDCCLEMLKETPSILGQLTSLTLTIWSITPEVLDLITSMCPSLEWLYLILSEGKELRIQEQSVEYSLTNGVAKVLSVSLFLSLFS